VAISNATCSFDGDKPTLRHDDLSNNDGYLFGFRFCPFPDFVKMNLLLSECIDVSTIFSLWNGAAFEL